jgi:hypothetical protein
MFLNENSLSRKLYRGNIFSRVRPLNEQAVRDQPQTCEPVRENQTFGIFSWKSLTKVVTLE